MPAAVVRHLGFDVDALNHRIVLPHDKHAVNCISLSSGFVPGLYSWWLDAAFPVAGLHRWLATCRALTLLCRSRAFFLRELHACLNSTSDWNAAVLLSSGARRELNTFWRRLDQHAHYTPWHHPLTSVILCTDASTCGWGAWLRTHSQPVHFYQHHWQTGELYTLASNHLELMAVY